MKKIRYIIIAMILPLFTMASDICEDGVKKYYEKDFITSSMLLQTCIEDKNSLHSSKDKAKFYITLMVAYKNIDETKKNLQYIEDLFQTQSRYVLYLNALHEWAKRNYEKSTKYYRSMLDTYLLSNPNQKIEPLNRIATKIQTVMSNTKGTPHSIMVSVVALNYQNIDNVKDKVIKHLLSRSIEELKGKQKTFVYDDREIDKNIIFLDFSINGKKTIEVSQDKTISKSDTLTSTYTLAQEYFKNQHYKTAMIYFKHIIDDILYQEIYYENKMVVIQKPQKSTTVSVEKKLVGLKEIYLIKLDISFEATKPMDKKYLKKTINDILDERLKEELLTVGGIAMFKEEVVDKINKDNKEDIVKNIFLLSYDLKMQPWKMQNDVTVKPKKINQISSIKSDNYLLNKNTLQSFKSYNRYIDNEYKIDENSVYIMKYGEYFVANSIGEIKKLDQKEIKLLKKADNKPLTNMEFLSKGYRYLIVTNKDTIMIYNVQHKENELVFKKQISNNSIRKIITEESSSKIYYFTNDYGDKYLRYSLAYIDPADKNSTIQIAYKNDTMISDAIISNKSNIIAIADNNGKIKIIDKKSFQLKDTLIFDKEKKKIKIAISSDGKNILAVYEKKDIVLWDLETKKIKYKVKNDNLNITSFDINEDTLNLAFNDGSVRLYDLKDGQYLARYYPFENKQSIFIYQDGTYKATKDIDKYSDVLIKPYDK